MLRFGEKKVAKEELFGPKNPKKFWMLMVIIYSSQN